MLPVRDLIYSCGYRICSVAQGRVETIAHRAPEGVGYLLFVGWWNSGILHQFLCVCVCVCVCVHLLSFTAIVTHQLSPFVELVRYVLCVSMLSLCD